MRKHIRKRIKSPATNLQTYVVNTICDFKDELFHLENDNNELQRENDNLHKLNQNLQEQNHFMMEEIENKNNRIKNLIETFGTSDICYNCSHQISCNLSSSLCCYCFKWVCQCCTTFCHFVENIQIDKPNCLSIICNSCSLTHTLCPKHYPGYPLERAEEIMEKYKKERHKRYLNQ